MRVFVLRIVLAVYGTGHLRHWATAPYIHKEENNALALSVVHGAECIAQAVLSMEAASQVLFEG